MKDRQKFSVRAFGNDGRRKKNEGDLVHSETAVEDFNGSGDSVADPVRLDLCGDCLCLRFGAGAYQHGGCPAGCGSSDYFLISPYGLPMAAIWLLGKVQDLKFIIQDLVYG